MSKDITVDGSAGLSGTKLDLNATPDALPALAVAACFASGETTLGNVPQARLKETDRITAMRRELGKLLLNLLYRPVQLRIPPGGVILRCDLNLDVRIGSVVLKEVLEHKNGDLGTALLVTMVPTIKVYFRKVPVPVLLKVCEVDVP